MMWVVWAVLATWLYCASTEINKYYKVEGLRLTFLRSLVACIYMLPFIPFMEISTSDIYYLVALVGGVLSVLGMRIQFNLAAEHNGRVANLCQPITIISTFIVWLFIDSTEWDKLTSDYFYAGGVLLSLCIMLVSLQFLRRHDTGWAVLKSGIIIGVLFMLEIILSKLMLDTGENSLPTALAWVFFGNMAIVIAALPVLGYQKRLNKELFQCRQVNLSALYGSVFHTTSWVFVSLAFIAVSNPAYPAVIATLSPVWFAIYYKLRGEKDAISPLAGLGLALSAVVLLLVTS